MIINTTKTKRWRGHPLQDKIDKGEIQLIDHLDIPEDEFQAKIAILEPEEQEIAIWARQKRLKISPKGVIKNKSEILQQIRKSLKYGKVKRG